MIPKFTLDELRFVHDVFENDLSELELKGGLMSNYAIVTMESIVTKIRDYTDSITVDTNSF